MINSDQLLVTAKTLFSTPLLPASGGAVPKDEHSPPISSPRKNPPVRYDRISRVGLNEEAE